MSVTVMEAHVFPKAGSACVWVKQERSSAPLGGEYSNLWSFLCNIETYLLFRGFFCCRVLTSDCTIGETLLNVRMLYLLDTGGTIPWPMGNVETFLVDCAI